MKRRVLVATGIVVLLTLVLGFAALAQEEPPSPYAGMKDPLPWEDATALSAGKGIYQRSCQSCHGNNGASLKTADFGSKEFTTKLKARPDAYFWMLSEGRLQMGMPPFKSSLSADERWQVLNYISSLSSTPAAQPAALPPSASLSMLLNVPVQARAGLAAKLLVSLRDADGTPVKGATVSFALRANFFGDGLLDLGSAVTDDKGLATIDFTPVDSGNAQLVAKTEGAQATATLAVVGGEGPSYEVQAGLTLPSGGPQVFFGPASAVRPTEMGQAPGRALRLPGGVFSWLWLLVGVIMAVWITYFRVIYQLFKITPSRRTAEGNVRAIPVAGLAAVVLIALTLVYVILTSPFSHFNLMH